MKIIMGIILSGAVIFAADLGMYLNGVKVMKVNPLDVNARAIDTGGPLTAIDAYSDGIGLIIGSGVHVVGEKNIDNSSMTSLVYKYGTEAAASGVSVADQVILSGTASEEEIIAANKLKVIEEFLIPEDGTLCDDGIETTINDSYIGGECVGKFTNCSAENLPITRAELDILISDGEDVTGVCTSGITNMNKLFYGYTTFNQDIGSWDTSKVTDMGVMFYNARAFDQDISGWDTSSVTDMSSMFIYAYAFNKPIDNWDVSNVIDMTSMFASTKAFNQNLNNWDVSNVTKMASMFYISEQFDGDISGWDVSNVVSMTNLFNKAYKFKKDLSGWCVEGYTSEPLGFDTSATLYAGQTAIQPKWGELCQ